MSEFLDTVAFVESTDVPAGCYAMHPWSVSHDKVQHMVMFVIYTCMSLFQKEYVSWHTGQWSAS